MNQQEFIQVTTRAETYFDKEYSNEQKKIMYDMLKEWNIKDYAKAITKCIENCKYLPKISDIKQMKTEYKPDYNNKEDNFEYVNCDKCKRKGLIQYFKKWEDNRYEYLALCTCENGKHLKQAEYSFLPFINEINKI